MALRVTARQLQAYGIFRKHGLSKKGAGAPVGNFVQESGVNLDSTMYRVHPDASGGVRQDLKSGGIAEWLGDRKLACITFSRAKEDRLGLPPDFLLNDLETQCEFVVHELKHGESGDNPSQYAELWRQLTTETLDSFGRPRSIATLTANFMTMYERPKMGAGTDRLGEVRIPYAEAVADRYELVEEAEKSEPRPAPPTPLPQVPGPTAPPPVFPPPAPPSGLPPVSASTAGRQAAELNMIAATLANLDSEIATIQAERAAWQLAYETIGNLSPVPAIDAPVLTLPKPAGSPAITERTQTMFGITNWKTTLGGLAAILTAAGSGAHALSTGDMSSLYASIPGILAGLGLMGGKDNNVSGGTISAMTGKTIAIETTVPPAGR